ncbi:MAG: hypothetical protein HN380_34665, partial [Victivallales bacterium]|nr:hypothetical protein [Victivallales bacterium]
NTVAGNAQSVAAGSQEANQAAKDGQAMVVETIKGMENIKATVDNAYREVEGLGEKSEEIGKIIAVIDDIAAQTNLLALNATIEAARAGDAGKGFAVVASEVKNLANQTAKATEEIGGQINGIQSATQDSVQAIQGITKTIGEISEIASAIAAAVEEQGAATSEIARNVEQAAAGTG